MADKDYGPRVERPDANPNEMKLRTAQHMKMLRDWQKKTMCNRRRNERAISKRYMAILSHKINNCLAFRTYL